MELTQLKYFQAMAKCHHFTQAAEEMAVSQSALSRSIQKLEQELGITLFERHGRTSELTEAGQKFLFHVDRVIRELALAEQEIELDNGGELWKQLDNSGGLGIYVTGDFPALELSLWAIRA